MFVARGRRRFACVRRGQTRSAPRMFVARGRRRFACVRRVLAELPHFQVRGRRCEMNTDIHRNVSRR